MSLYIENDIGESKESICNYLNDRLYTEPEFFGLFEENSIVSVEDDNSMEEN
jgi:hypothetical protein